MVNDALGALPDYELITTAPAPVRDAVTYGRPAAIQPGHPASALVGE